MDAPADPTQITPAQAAELLSKEGGAVITQAQIEADVQAGAPTNADGTLNLLHYAAWILKQSSA
jgi:hypothetical protein